ncbi:MAG: metallophosphoesterase [Clostridia bacterium]|nr:metallophosphoesterase [Clostridia bacterium]
MTKRKIAVLIVLGVILIAVAVVAVVMRQVPFQYDFDSIAPIESDLTLLSADDPLNQSGSPALAKVRDGKISDEEIKILFLTDVHLCERQDSTAETIDRLVTYVEREQPDLIILGGDTLNGLNDKVRVYQFRNLMDAFQIHWAPVLGNHEGDRPLFMTDRDKVVEIWSASPYCLMESDTKYTADGRVVDGFGNYVLSLLGADGRIKNAFFMLDNGGKLEKSDYAKWGIDKNKKKVDVAISEAQVDWYRETYAVMKEKNGGELTHMCVIHKPLQEMGAAILLPEEITYGDVIENWDFTAEAKAAGWTRTDGDLRDKIHCPPYTDGKLYEALVENGAKAVFFGHDHVSDLTLYNAKDDIYLTYIRLTTVTEEIPDAEGYNVMILGADGAYAYNAYKPDGALDAALFAS